MKKWAILATGVALVMGVIPVSAGKPEGLPGKGNECTTIQDGTLVDSNGDPLVLGFDRWGYNYQALLFNGRYCDYRRSDTFKAWCESQGWGDIALSMKWNEA